MYRVYDTFNSAVRSNHRTLEGAVKASRALGKAIEKANGRNSYLPRRIEQKVNGEWVPCDNNDVERAENRISELLEARSRH